jgi:hypothetical protein
VEGEILAGVIGELLQGRSDYLGEFELPLLR